MQKKSQGSTFSRGVSEIKIKRLNGSFMFKVRRYVINGKSTNWLRLSGSELDKLPSIKHLRSSSVRLAILVSYGNCESLISERMGNDKLSYQGVMHIVSSAADAIKESQSIQLSNCKSI